MDEPDNSARLPFKNKGTGKSLFLCHVLMLLAAGVMLAAVVNYFGMPVPCVHDEFCYLLQAKTFAAGRLTNPTPRYHEFLETFHVIMKPSYTAKYFPGQALPLTLGCLLGLPAIGLWLTGLALVPLGIELFRRVSDLYCGCVVALFVYVRFFLFSYFGHSYWGGSFFMLCGGIMILGVFLFREHRVFLSALLFGTGSGLCMITRPYEGLFLGVACLVCIIILAISDRRRNAVKFGLVALALVMIFGAGLLIYNRAVTGCCLTLPYSIYTEEYLPGYRTFIWQHPVAKPADKPEMFNTWAAEHVKFNRMTFFEFAGFGAGEYFKKIRWIMPYYSWALFVPLVVYLLVRRKFLGWFFLVSMLLLLVACVLTANNYWKHYYSPWIWLGGLLYAMTIHLCLNTRWLRTQQAGHALKYVPPLVLLVVSAHSAYMAETDPIVLDRRWERREEIQRELLEKHKQTGKQYLVFVRPRKSPHIEFVYNAPCPYSSPIVWARSLGRKKDRELMEYLDDRKVFYIVDKEARLEEYHKNP